MDRRQFITASGTLAAAALAGCGSPDDDDDESEDDGSEAGGYSVDKPQSPTSPQR